MVQTISGKAYRGATPDPAQATREAMVVAREGGLPLVEVFYSLQGEGGGRGRGETRPREEQGAPVERVT